ncbi:hypothetical protein [Brevibacillus marinus]|uniref:hypothetical protein n=1 Tax=Brevibacillus marinus TaxID=2496837 RepID=UPI000F8421FC|nr:hypothetical protein [Brevibacillus marinus]
MKLGKLWMAITFTLCLLTGCANDDWSYRFEGTGEHWRAILDVIPVTDESKRDFLGDVVYIGALEKIKDFAVESLTYEAEINNSYPGGMEKRPDFPQNEIVRIFVDVPNTDAEAKAFKRGMSKEELQAVLTHVSFTIKWENETGEYSESIILEVSD